MSNSLKLNNFLREIKLKKHINLTISLFLSTLDTLDYKNTISYLISNSLIPTFVKYIVYITHKKSNIFMHLFDSTGNQISFYSIISLLKLKKNKIKKSEILNKFYSTLISKHYEILKNTKIEIMLNRDQNFLFLFVEKIKLKLFLINLKFYTNNPYNGCRRKKK